MAFSPTQLPSGNLTPNIIYIPTIFILVIIFFFLNDDFLSLLFLCGQSLLLTQDLWSTDTERSRRCSSQNLSPVPLMVNNTHTVPSTGSSVFSQLCRLLSWRIPACLANREHTWISSRANYTNWTEVHQIPRYVRAARKNHVYHAHHHSVRVRMVLPRLMAEEETLGMWYGYPFHSVTHLRSNLGSLISSVILIAKSPLTQPLRLKNA